MFVSVPAGATTHSHFPVTASDNVKTSPIDGGVPLPTSGVFINNCDEPSIVTVGDTKLAVTVEVKSIFDVPVVAKVNTLSNVRLNPDPPNCLFPTLYAIIHIINFLSTTLLRNFKTICKSIIWGRY